MFTFLQMFEVIKTITFWIYIITLSPTKQTPAFNGHFIISVVYSRQAVKTY